MFNVYVMAFSAAAAAVVAIGTFVYQNYQQQQERQQYRNYNNYYNPKERNSRNQTKASCAFCGETLAGVNILRLRICKHVYHERCVSILKAMRRTCVWFQCEAPLIE